MCGGKRAAEICRKKSKKKGKNKGKCASLEQEKKQKANKCFYKGSRIWNVRESGHPCWRQVLAEWLLVVDVKLTEEDLARLDQELPPTAGDRYDEAGMAALNL